MNFLRYIDTCFTDNERLLGLLGVNVALASVDKWAAKLDMFLKVLVPLGQFAVAVATVYYLLKKAYRMDHPKLPKQDDPDEGD